MYLAISKSDKFTLTPHFGIYAEDKKHLTDDYDSFYVVKAPDGHGLEDIKDTYGLEWLLDIKDLKNMLGHFPELRKARYDNYIGIPTLTVVSGIANNRYGEFDIKILLKETSVYNPWKRKIHRYVIPEGIEQLISENIVVIKLFDSKMKIYHIPKTLNESEEITLHDLFRHGGVYTTRVVNISEIEEIVPISQLSNEEIYAILIDQCITVEEDLKDKVIITTDRSYNLPSRRKILITRQTTFTTSKIIDISVKDI